MCIGSVQALQNGDQSGTKDGGPPRVENALHNAFSCGANEQKSSAVEPDGSPYGHEALQFLEPVLHDLQLGTGRLLAAELDHEESFAIRRNIVPRAGLETGRRSQIAAFKQEPRPTGPESGPRPDIDGHYLVISIEKLASASRPPCRLATLS